MNTIEQIEKYQVLEAIDKRLFVVCDLFDGDLAICPSMSNHIYMKEVNTGNDTVKLTVKAFKELLQENKLWIWKR